MADWMNGFLAQVNQMLESAGFGRLADGNAWASMWSEARSPQGIALLLTIAAAVVIGIVFGRLWGRRPPAPPIQAAPQPVPQPVPEAPPSPVPEAAPAETAAAEPPPAEAAPPRTVPRDAIAAMRDELAAQGLDGRDLELRMRDFRAGLTQMRSLLVELAAADPETRPAVETARLAFRGGEFDAALQALDQARWEFLSSARAMANSAEVRQLASTRASILAGDIELFRRNYAAAHQLFARAAETVPDGDVPLLVSILTKQATSSFRAGDLEDADRLFQRIVRGLEQSRGPDHPEVARSLSRLASVRYARNLPDDAERLYRRAFAINRKAYGDAHATVALDLGNLAQLLMRQGKGEEAEPLLKRVLAIRQTTLGPAHPDVMAAAQEYAALLRRLKRVKEANAVLADVAIARRAAVHAAE